MTHSSIDRKAGSAFRVRSRRDAARQRLVATLERGTRYDRALNTHVALDQGHTDRIEREITTLISRTR